MRSFQVCCGVSGRFGSYQPGQLLVSEDSEIPMHAIRRASAGAIPLRGDIGASLRGDKSDGRSKCSSTTSPLSAFFVAVAAAIHLPAVLHATHCLPHVPAVTEQGEVPALRKVLGERLELARYALPHQV